MKVFQNGNNLGINQLNILEIPFLNFRNIKFARQWTVEIVF